MATKKTSKSKKTRATPADRKKRIEDWRDREERREREREEHKHALNIAKLDHEHQLALEYDRKKNAEQFDLFKIGRQHKDPLAIVITGAELREMFTKGIARFDEQIADFAKTCAEAEAAINEMRAEHEKAGLPPQFVGMPDPAMAKHMQGARDALVFHRDHLATGDDEKITLDRCTQQELALVLNPPVYGIPAEPTGRRVRRVPPVAN